MSTEIRQISLADIIPTPDNPRVFSKKPSRELLELAASIAKHGILQPVLARPHPTEQGKFDLRAGERRFRAAGIARQSTIPVIIREMTDDEALEITTIENMQREDLSPIEEARGIQAMINHGRTHEEIADKLGKPKTWVARRARISNLTKVWKEGTEALQLWTAGHYELIATFEPDTQDLIARELKGNTQVPRYTIKELNNYLVNYLRNIAGAPFKVADETLGAPACSACQKRSDCQPDLFDPEEEEENKKGKKKSAGVLCLDAACWDKKIKVHVQRQVVELRATNPNLLVCVEDWKKREEMKKKNPFGVEIVSNYNLHSECTQKTKDAVPAIHLDGPKSGRITWHLARETSSPPRSQSKKSNEPTPLKVLRERKYNQRQMHAIDALQKALETVAETESPKNTNLPIDAGDPKPIITIPNDLSILRLVAAFGTDFRQDNIHHHMFSIDPFQAAIQFANSDTIPDYIDTLVCSLAKVFLSRIHSMYGNPNWPEAQRIASVWQFNLDQALTEATIALPDPKSWAKREAQEKEVETPRKASSLKPKSTPKKAKK